MLKYKTVFWESNSTSPGLSNSESLMLLPHRLVLTTTEKSKGTGRGSQANISSTLTDISNMATFLPHFSTPSLFPSSDLKKKKKEKKKPVDVLIDHLRKDHVARKQALGFWPNLHLVLGPHQSLLWALVSSSVKQGWTKWVITHLKFPNLQEPLKTY